MRCSWKLPPAQVDSSGPGRTAAHDPSSRQLSALICATRSKHTSDSSQIAYPNKYQKHEAAQNWFVLETRSSLQRFLSKAKSELGLSNHHCSLVLQNTQQKAHLKKFNHVIWLLQWGCPLRSADSFLIIAFASRQNVSDIQGRFGSCMSSQARQGESFRRPLRMFEKQA
jgi:hypothetical protein